MKFVSVVIAAVCVASACDAPVVPAAAADQVEASCERAVGALRHYKNNGLRCEDAKALVAQEEPLCELQFTCPGPRDGGAQ